MHVHVSECDTKPSTEYTHKKIFNYFFCVVMNTLCCQWKEKKTFLKLSLKLHYTHFFIIFLDFFQSLVYVNKSSSYLFDLALRPSNRGALLHFIMALKGRILFKMCLWKVIIALWHLNWMRDCVIVKLSVHTGESIRKQYIEIKTY